MKKLVIGVESAVWYDPSAPEESIRFIKECGFEAVDFSFNAMYRKTFDEETLTSFYDKSLEELYAYYEPLKNAAIKYGVCFPQTHGTYPIYCDGNEAKTDYNIKIVEKQIAISAFLGCRAIVIHPTSCSELHKNEELETNLNMYRCMIPYAKKYGVKICLENLFMYYDLECYEGTCSHVDEVCWYVDTLNAEAGENLFGFCLDVGHAAVTGANLYQYITTLGNRLTVLHIQDNDGNSDAHMIPLTQMDRKGRRLRIDWEKFIRGLKEIGYDGPLCFETSRGIDVLPPELRKDGLQFISAIGRYFRKRILE